MAFRFSLEISILTVCPHKKTQNRQPLLPRSGCLLQRTVLTTTKGLKYGVGVTDKVLEVKCR